MGSALLNPPQEAQRDPQRLLQRPRDEHGEVRLMATQLPSARVDRLTLLHHGTQPCRLSPSAIVQTAKSDLRHREANRELRRLRKNGMASRDVGTLYRYAFHSSHLKDSHSVADVLRKAIKGHAKGVGASEVGRSRIYSDVALLEEALSIVEPA